MDDMEALCAVAMGMDGIEGEMKRESGSMVCVQIFKVQRVLIWRWLSFLHYAALDAADSTVLTTMPPHPPRPLRVGIASTLLSMLHLERY